MSAPSFPVAKLRKKFSQESGDCSLITVCQGCTGSCFLLVKSKKVKGTPQFAYQEPSDVVFLASSLIIRKYTATVDISSHLNSWIISITAELLLMQV